MKSILLLTAVGFFSSLIAQTAPPKTVGWHSVPEILARIKAPHFPARDFKITDHGAVAGGADCTAAIAQAIATANAAGGGRVVVPPGEFHTAAIHLRSNVNLHVSEGATLRFSTDPTKYPIVFTRWEGVECMNYSALIYAFEQENIAVTGKGTLDGAADWDNWWSWNDKRKPPVKQKTARDRLIEMGENGVAVADRKFGDGGFLRPNFIQPYRCRNVSHRRGDDPSVPDVGNSSGSFHQRDRSRHQS